MDLHARNTDFVFTAKVRSQSSSVLFVNGMPGVDPAPALFTRMSILPHASRVRSTIALTSAELVTSVFIATSSADVKRSEEHTSELQSQSNLVCRLLLEKKKNELIT